MCCCSQSAVSFLKPFPSDFGFSIHPPRLYEARAKELAAIWLDHHMMVTWNMQASAVK